MRLFLKLLFICIMFIPVALLQQRDAQAIPVFARKYRTACTTCHWGAFPRLNAFGMAFRSRNYRIPPEDEIYIKEEPVALGSEGYKKVFPDAIWPSTIPWLPPLSIAMGSDFNINTRTAPDDAKYSFTGIAEFELLTAGTLGESFSWFGAVVLNEAGDYNYESGTEIERLYWQYTPRWLPGGDDEPGIVSVRFGVFETRAAPNRQNLRLVAITGFLSNTMPIVPTGNYTRMGKQTGLEVFGAHNGFFLDGKGGLRWAVGVVNGSPGGFGDWDTTAYGDSAAISANVSGMWEGKFDVNNSKDVYGRVMYKLWGMPVLGGTKEGLGSSKPWRDDSVTVGGFFYRGKTGYFHDPVAGTGWSNSGNTFWRYGGQVQANWWNFEGAFAATMFSENPNHAITIGGRSGKDFDARLYTARLAMVTPGLPWVIPAAKVEHGDFDYDTGDWPSFTRTSLDLTLLIRANIKAVTGGYFTKVNSWRGGARPGALSSGYHMSMEVAY